MVFDLLRLDRKEGSGADMQGEGLAADPALVERLEQPLGEMERGGWRGDRSFLPSKHGLVILAIRFIDVAPRCDVGREGHSARAFEQQFDRLVAMELKQRRSVVGLLDDQGADSLAKVDAIAFACALGVAKERLP